MYTKLEVNLISIWLALVSFSRLDPLFDLCDLSEKVKRKACEKWGNGGKGVSDSHRIRDLLSTFEWDTRVGTWLIARGGNFFQKCAFYHYNTVHVPENKRFSQKFEKQRKNKLLLNQNFSKTFNYQAFLTVFTILE